MEFTLRSLQGGLSSAWQDRARSTGVSIYGTGGTLRRREAPSVYGGAGGKGVRISTSKHMVGCGNDLARREMFVGNEKMTMQNLNDRLASYLEKVHSLEQSNSNLELLIKQWYQKNTPSTRDDCAYFQQIKELQNQIKTVQLQNTRCVLQIDNAKLTAANFRLKYEAEREMRLTVESDIEGLNKVSADLSLRRTDLEVQIKELTKELDLLKKEHQEEVDILRKHLSNTVSVELDTAPARDLGALLNEMRQKYEVIVQENLQKAKEQFETQTELLQQHVTVSTQEIKDTEVQLKELRHTYRDLEIKLQSHLTMKESLEHTLEETRARYASQLATIKALLNSIEVQLTQIWTDTERQNKEYNALFDIKTRLEQEIATYRRLLEGEDVTQTNRTTEYQKSTLEEKDVKKKRKIRTIVEEVVDGKVVSYETKEMEEDM
ncbi:keratin, type I cytoskeletal 20 [Suricata suricatta]|uniref:Keratin, type I cytoskeletal 20 n=1 Tax=Suricata suricatta TaxID=37032 RepID=A0A673V886_SURSU|nr:keratin, type I cytoskeletal 20 [Suricata suricatta]